jgi:16S rRNA (cytosine1402-N4)-methyltransferase
MVREVVSHLAPDRGGLFVDCTVGLGGHATALLEGGASQVLGLDRDPAAIERSRDALARWGDRVALVHADYRDLPRVLADLGVSSMQLDAPGRGFSFRRDEPLDMRMDTSRGPTASEALQQVDEAALADVIFGFGEERYSRKVARAIVEARRSGPIETTGRLAEIVRRAIPYRGHQRIDPATRTFQAIRIWINRELDGLEQFVGDATTWLKPGGRMVIITFHSLEDRIVKHTLRALAAQGGITVRTKRPETADEAEVDRNPRARSAKLRAAEWAPGSPDEQVDA